MSSSPHSPFKRLLVANRGEIAVRILHAARELPTPIELFVLYTSDDRSHCDLGRPQHAIEIPSASTYLDISYLVNLAKKHSIDAVHPGYGFLSESADFAYRMFHEAGAIVIGPGWENLARTGDKLQAKQLAQKCGVPTLDFMLEATGDVDEARAFAEKIGLPVMVKAADGGGGRGIRLVRQESELVNNIQRAIGESPSRSVFVEKAAVDGFHHVEVQIVGDRTGRVRHLWERDCSAQRRFQKVVECAPALMERALVGKVIEAALRMAGEVRYHSLGTFEFLVSEQRQEFYFLEVNARLQVEHTITEAISGVDLVQTQLLLAQGWTLSELGLDAAVSPDQPAPNAFSIQLRLCAEDPENAFALSVGKVTGFSVPSGHGIRVDTNVDPGSPLVVGSNFDNLLAKIIVTASSWEATVRKAQRVLADSHIQGVTTNINLLRAIVAHPDFMSGQVDTQWLGLNLDTILQQGKQITSNIPTPKSSLSSNSAHQTTLPASNLLFRKGDAWSITLEPLSKDTPETAKVAHHLSFSRVLRNEFPNSLTAEIEYTTPASRIAMPYRMQLETTTTAASALVSSHRRGDPRNPHHIVLPLSGRLIEVLVSSGDEVVQDQVLAFVKQMKMELEVRSPRSGKVKWVYEMEEEEEDVAEGILLVELEGEVELRGKL
ncbi:ATP-grasp fold subdomain 1 [Penicillium brevicompactum]|uniref:ATP-grasp fold subdomain 1 n=1 Tax=Penicillium brevicompactum TaxID=5074 RepID=A0A9W9QYG0_PENBR|nr:ATP-grasp fold subdomain 1 [Penicillium brevicompactum]